MRVALADVAHACVVGTRVTHITSVVRIPTNLFSSAGKETAEEFNLAEIIVICVWLCDEVKFQFPRA